MVLQHLQGTSCKGVQPTHKMRSEFLILAFVVSMTSASVLKQPSRNLLQGGCSGIDVTASPYSADPSGAKDSAPAFNAAIAAASGTMSVTRTQGSRDTGRYLVESMIGRQAFAMVNAYMLQVKVSASLLARTESRKTSTSITTTSI